MAVFDVTDAVSYLGKTVLFELSFEDDDEGIVEIWRCVHVVGVVLELQGVYPHPHFLCFDLPEPGGFPSEVFWSDVKTSRVLGVTNGPRVNRIT